MEIIHEFRKSIKNTETITLFINQLNSILHDNDIVKEQIITNKDIDGFILFMTHNHINMCLLKYIVNHVSSFKCNTFASEVQLKNFLILIYYYFFYDKTDPLSMENTLLINRIIAQLFNRHFGIKEIIIIAKLWVILASYRQSRSGKSANRKGKIIDNIAYIRLSFELLENSFKTKTDSIEETEANHVIDYIFFFEDYIISNRNNCRILSKELTSFPLMSLIKKHFNSNNSNTVNKKLSEKINHLSYMIFKFQFKASLMKDLVNDFKSVIINHTQTLTLHKELIGNLTFLDHQIDFIKNCQLNEYQDNQKDVYNFPSGFYFDNNGKTLNGIKITIDKFKVLTMIFGMKYFPNKQSEKMALLTFYSDKSDPIFAFIIQENNLYLEQYGQIKDSEPFHLLMKLEPMISYVFLLQMEISMKTKKLIMKLMTHSIRDIIEYSFLSQIERGSQVECTIGIAIPKQEEEKMKNSIAKANENKTMINSLQSCLTFRGEIGTLIFFSDFISEETKKYLLMLRGNYLHSLLYQKYELSFIMKYFNNEVIRSKRYLAAKDYFTYSDIKLFASLICIISPKSCQLNSKGSCGELIKSNDSRFPNTVNLQWNYLSLKEKDMVKQNFKTILLSPLSNSFIVFDYHSTLLEFLKYDGLNYLVLHLEYYNQLLNDENIFSTSNEDIINKIFTNIDNLLCLFFHILDKINIEDYQSGIMTIFHMISIILDKLTRSRKLKHGPLFAELFKIFIALKLEIQLIMDNIRDNTQDYNNSSTITSLKNSMISTTSNNSTLTQCVHFDSSDCSNEKIIQLLYLRAQFTFMLLNDQLYDLEDKKTVFFLFETITNILSQFPDKGLINPSILERILAFSEKYAFATYSNEHSIISMNCYFKLLSVFFMIEQNNINFNILCEFIYARNKHHDLFYFYIQLLFFNENLMSLFHDVNMINLLLKGKINEESTSKDEKFFILMLMLYIEININTEKNVINRENSNQMDIFLMQINDTTSSRIKSILLSLYKNQVSNEEKFKCVVENKPLPVMKESFNYEEGISLGLFSSCLMILQDLSKEDKIFYQEYSLIIQFIERTLDLPETNLFFINFYHKENKSSIIQLFTIATNAKLDWSSTWFLLIDNLISRHANPFIFDFLSEIYIKEDRNIFVFESFNMIMVKFLEINESIPNYKYYLYNLINLTMLYYEDITEDQTNTLFLNCEYRKLFFSLVGLLSGTGILYMKVLFTIKLSSKLLSEIVFEIFMILLGKIYQRIKDEETNERPNLIALLENSFIKKKQNITYSLFYCSDYLVIDHVIESSKTLSIRDIEENFFKENSCLKCNFTIYFLKVIVNEYHKKPEEGNISTDCEKIKQKLLDMAKVIYEDIIALIKSSYGKKNYISKEMPIDNRDDYRKIRNYFINYKNSCFDDFLNEYMKKNETKDNSETESRKDSNQDNNNNGLVKASSYSINDSQASSKYDARSVSTQLTGSDNKIMSYIKQKIFPVKDNIIKEVRKEEDEDDQLIIDYRDVLFKGFYLNPNNFFLLQHFGIFFKDIMFHNEVFIKMKEYYLSNQKINPATKALKYPSKRKRFSIGTLPPIFLKQDQDFFTSKYFSVSHQYYTERIKREECNLKQITLKKHDIHISNHQKSLASFPCELIIYGTSYFGLLNVYDQFIVFKTQDKGHKRTLYDNADINYLFTSLLTDRSKDNKEKLLYHREIKEIITKKFVQLHQAIEIYLKNGKSYYFNMISQENLDDLSRILDSMTIRFEWKLVINCQKDFKKEKYATQWEENTITPYDYIFILNKYSSRSFNDINQYFIFPWVIISYPNNQIFTFPLDKSIIRDFKRPISLQNEEKYQKKLLQSEETFDDFWNRNKFGGHFSTCAFVFYYLMRINPFNQELIKLQNMNLENPNRMFHTFEEILYILLTSEDNRELTPEFFCSVDFMLNLNCNYFGSREKFQIDDLYFSQKNSLSEYVQATANFWKLLNRTEVAQLLHSWIDLAFGVNQQYKKTDLMELVKSYNELLKEQQETSNEEDKMYQEKKLKDIMSKLFHIIQTNINFGQPPSKLFSKYHPIYSNNSSTITDFEMNTNSNDSTGITGNCLNRLCQIMNKAHVYYITTINHYLIILNTDQIIEVYDIKYFGDKKKVIDIEFNKFKLFSKLCPKDKKIKSHILKEKYAFTILNSDSETTDWIFVVGRYQDHSIKIYQYHPKKKCLANEILIEDFVCCVASVERMIFIIGLRNGKLIECECLKNTNYDSKSAYMIQERKYVIAHESDINAIEVKKEIGIVITAGSDNYIYIRKLHDFELLTVIENDARYLVTEIKLSPMNLLYSSCYDSKTKRSVLKGYTLTGIHFETSQPMDLITYYFSSASNIMVGCYKDNMFYVLSPSNLKMQGQIKLGNTVMNNWFYAYESRVILLETNLTIDIYKLSTDEIETYQK